MTVEMYKGLEIILLVIFGILMYSYVIDLMELPKIIVPYAKAASIVGTTVMIGCAVV